LLTLAQAPAGASGSISDSADGYTGELFQPELADEMPTTLLVVQ
jgi:hypothetical protein